jgi:hypothetical protein
MIFSAALAIFRKNDVQVPVQLVFNTPMVPGTDAEIGRRLQFTVDIKPGFELYLIRFVFETPFTLHHDDTPAVRPPPKLVHESQLMTNVSGTPFNSATHIIRLYVIV